jgi:hypothetical protein
MQTGMGWWSAKRSSADTVLAVVPPTPTTTPGGHAVAVDWGLVKPESGSWRVQCNSSCDSSTAVTVLVL